MTMESLSAVQSTLAPWRNAAPWMADLTAIVDAGLGGIAVAEAALPDNDSGAVRDVTRMGLRTTTVEPAVRSILGGGNGNGPRNPERRIDEIRRCVRRTAAFAPSAVAFAADDSSIPKDVTRDEVVAWGLQQIARTGRDAHPHGIPVALLSGSVGCSPSQLSAFVRSIDESNVRVVVELSKLTNRTELAYWATCLDLVATVRLQVYAPRPFAGDVEAIFRASDLDLQTAVTILAEAGYRHFGFYEAEFVPHEGPDGEPKDGDELVSMLKKTRDLVRSAVRPHLVTTGQ